MLSFISSTQTDIYHHQTCRDALHLNMRKPDSRGGRFSVNNFHTFPYVLHTDFKSYHELLYWSWLSFDQCSPPFPSMVLKTFFMTSFVFHKRDNTGIKNKTPEFWKSNLWVLKFSSGMAVLAYNLLLLIYFSSAFTLSPVLWKTISPACVTAANIDSY